MRSCVVVVAYEAPVLIEQVRLRHVRLVKSFNFANGCGPALASRNVLDSQLVTMRGKLRGSASCGLKLCSLISQNLLRNTVLPNSFVKQEQRVLSGWLPDLDRSGDEAGMIILEADHPVVVAAELKVRLPEAVAMFSLETLRSPGLSRLGYWMIQASFTDYGVNFVVVNGETSMSKVTRYFVWAPTVSLP